MPVTYDPIMVGASVLVAIMASFTGLRLASGLRLMDARARKVQIAKAAIALGGGIWSMHFVGMLAVQLPVTISYDALFTLGSVLIAILITGLGLYLMHVGQRTLAKTAAAGCLTGLGIVSMHYVGMEAIRGNCIVAYVPAGFVVSSLIAVGASICALALAYQKRTLVQLCLGAVLLGITISAMHYSAMAYTLFLPLDEAVRLASPILSDGYLALVVALAAFMVCAVFLLTALPIYDAPLAAAGALGGGGTFAAAGDIAEPAPVEPAMPDRRRVPYEQNNRTHFLDVERLCAIQADGHYTRLYDSTASYFCPWSISRLESHLAGRPFVRTHRSYLLNLDCAQAFQREKDKAYVIVRGNGETRVPVSRSHLADVRRALGL